MIMVLYRLCNFGLSEEQVRSKYNQYTLLQRAGTYYFSMGCMIVSNAEFNKWFLVKMATVSFPLPIAIIVGSNMTFDEVDTTNDVYFFFHSLFGSAYIILPFNYIYSYMKKSAVNEKNSKLETQDLLKMIVNNLKESIMICSNKQIDYVNNLFVNKFEM